MTKSYKELQPDLRRRFSTGTMRSIGNEGCYFLSLCQLAGIDPTDDNLRTAFDKIVSSGAMQQNCYVNDAAAIVSLLSGKKWTLKRLDVQRATKDAPGERDIICYLTGSGVGTHFVLWGGEDTEKHIARKILGHRIFKEV